MLLVFLAGLMNSTWYNRDISKGRQLLACFGHSMKNMHLISFTLLIIGGLNWLLIGLFGVDVVMYLAGVSAWLPRIVYVLVGLSAVYELFMHKKSCRMCNPSGM